MEMILMLTIFTVLLCYSLSSSTELLKFKAWEIQTSKGLEPWPLPCQCSAPPIELTVTSVVFIFRKVLLIVIFVFWTTVVSTRVYTTPIGPGKRRHIVADTNVSPFPSARNICCGFKKCFWFCSVTFCVRKKCFPACAAWKHKIHFVSRAYARPRNIMRNETATMCPRLPNPYALPQIRHPTFDQS